MKLLRLISKLKDLFVFLKKVLITILVVIAYLLCAILQISFPSLYVGTGDWTYSLPNNYEVIRINSRQIVLIRYPDEEKTTDELIVDRYIAAFCYNDVYVGIERLPAPAFADNPEIEITDIDPAMNEYYLVNTSDHSVFGPFNVKEYEQKIAELDIRDMCDWIETVPKPDGAQY